MSNKNFHIIQKQVIDITLPNTNAALDWELNKRHGFTAIINNQLEKCFDDYDKTGNHLIIEKLDIDLGIFSPDNLQAEMPDRLYSELHKKIEYQLSLLSEKEVPGGSRFGAGNEQNKDAGLFFNEQQGKLQALFFFLDKGYLPWWGSALADWDKNWLQKLTQNEANNFKNFLIASDSRLAQRIAIQFNDDFIYSLLQRMGVTANAKEGWSWLTKILKSLSQQEVPATAKQTGTHVSLPQIRADYWYNWIEHALGKTTTPSLNNLFDKYHDILISIQLAASKKDSGKTSKSFFDNVPGIWQEEINALNKEAKKKKHKAEEEGLRYQAKQLKDNSEDLSGESITNKENKPTDRQPFEAREKILPGDEPETSNKLSVKDQFSNKEAESKKDTEDDTDAVFITDAGLILLHPFLPQLFSDCGWLDKNSFVNDYTKTMAVYALYYLATGNIEALEHELVFHKFLAGIKWETPLEPVEPLNDKEKATCDELLKEVLQHWEPLRNTSPQGLREGFLQRSGKLEHIYSGWHLSIEQKTLDILLGRLPWGISLIKLPWMPGMLTVTWQ